MKNWIRQLYQHNPSPYLGMQIMSSLSTGGYQYQSQQYGAFYLMVDLLKKLSNEELLMLSFTYLI